MPVRRLALVVHIEQRELRVESGTRCRSFCHITRGFIENIRLVVKSSSTVRSEVPRSMLTLYDLDLNESVVLELVWYNHGQMLLLLHLFRNLFLIERRERRLSRYVVPQEFNICFQGVDASN